MGWDLFLEAYPHTREERSWFDGLIAAASEEHPSLSEYRPARLRSAEVMRLSRWQGRVGPYSCLSELVERARAADLPTPHLRSLRPLLLCVPVELASPVSVAERSIGDAMERSTLDVAAVVVGSTIGLLAELTQFGNELGIRDECQRAAIEERAAARARFLGHEAAWSALTVLCRAANESAVVLRGD